MSRIYGGSGISPTLRGQPTNVFSLEAGNSILVPPGTWNGAAGPYSSFQEKDPVTTTWRNIGGDSTQPRYILSDGNSVRLANQTGCVVGANITAAGSGYVTAPIVTDNGGANTPATYLAIVGGALATSITINNGGSLYVKAPNVQISAPPAPGVQATGYATISGGIVTSVTITNQGAGYNAAPTITFSNTQGDSTGSGAQATATLTGAGTITAILVTDHGSPITSTTTAPTLTLTGGGGTGATATALMCWTTTAYTVTSAGSGYVGGVLISAFQPATAASSYTNPIVQSGLVRARPAYYGAALSSTAVTATGQTIYDGGIFSSVPTGYVAGFATGSAAAVSFTMGGVTDTSYLYAV